MRGAAAGRWLCADVRRRRSIDAAVEWLPVVRGGPLRYIRHSGGAERASAIARRTTAAAPGWKAARMRPSSLRNTPCCVAARIVRSSSGWNWMLLTMASAGVVLRDEPPRESGIFAAIDGPRAVFTESRPSHAGQDDLRPPRIERDDPNGRRNCRPQGAESRCESIARSVPGRCCDGCRFGCPG